MSALAHYIWEELYRGGPEGHEPAGSSAPNKISELISNISGGKTDRSAEKTFSVSGKGIFSARSVGASAGTSIAIWSSKSEYRVKECSFVYELGLLIGPPRISKTDVLIWRDVPMSDLGATYTAVNTNAGEWTTLILADTPSATNIVACDTGAASDRIKKLVEEQKVDEARRELMDFTGPLGILDPDLAAWARLLAPPRFKEAAEGTGVDRQKALRELKATEGKFKDEWVALDENGVIGHNQSKVELYRELKASGKVSGSLFVYVA